jgi:hypothetical protein
MCRGQHEDCETRTSPHITPIRCNLDMTTLELSRYLTGISILESRIKSGIHPQNKFI